MGPKKWIVTVIASAACAIGALGEVRQAASQHPNAAVPVKTHALSPAEALQSFKVLDGFRVELVASEPDVTDPVAMALTRTA